MNQNNSQREIIFIVIGFILTTAVWSVFIVWQRDNPRPSIMITAEELKPLTPEINPDVLDQIRQRRGMPNK